MAKPRSALTPIYSQNQYTPMESMGKKYSGFNMAQDPYAPAQSSFQDMAMSGENYDFTLPVADATQSKGFMQGVSDWWNGTSAPTTSPTTTSTGGMSDWFKGTKDQKSPFEVGAAGVSALAGLYGAYKSGEYQDKMAKLQQHASDVYDKELAAKNQRMAQAQANYEASFK